MMNSRLKLAKSYMKGESFHTSPGSCSGPLRTPTTAGLLARKVMKVLMMSWTGKHDEYIDRFAQDAKTFK
jgi:hypothetical protein